MTVAKLSKEELEKLYLGKNVHVIYNQNDYEIDTWGKVTKVNSNGTVCGTWGDYVVTPGADYISLYD